MAARKGESHVVMIWGERGSAQGPVYLGGSLGQAIVSAGEARQTRDLQIV